MRAQAIQCISKSIDRLVALLEAVDANRHLPTSYGLLHPPVGLARLKAVELLAALLHSGDEAAGGTCAVQHTVPLVFSAATRMKWTNCTRNQRRTHAGCSPLSTCNPVFELAPANSSALVCAPLLIAESAVMSTRGVQRSMQLFLQFPFNNVLHRHVATLVTAVDQGSARLAEFLLKDCGLLGWLADAPTEVR